MKYFAMIDGQRRGPYSLRELVDVGVRPDTYVWCKGMVDWQRARYVADICRFFRNRLAGINTEETESQLPSEPKPSQFPPDEKPEPENLDSVPLSFRNMVRKSGSEIGKPLETKEDISVPPPSLMVYAVIVCILFFPAGIAALYYASVSRKEWKAAEAERDAGHKQQWQAAAHAAARQAKMWIGITFFLSLIFYSFIIRYFL